MTRAVPSSRNPHRDPIVLSTGRSAWVECRCGWLGPTCKNPLTASAAWAAHVLRELHR